MALRDICLAISAAKRRWAGYPSVDVGFPPATAALAELDHGWKRPIFYPSINGRLANACALQDSGKPQDFV
jgi:hypothetical protein